MRLLTAFTFATAAAASTITKRCSPLYDPELAKGYLPPAPCWQSFDPACQPYIARDTSMTIDAKHKAIIVYGISKYCEADIAEELAREAAGRKNNRWTTTHGNLTVIPGGILFISNVTEANLARYQKLNYEGSAPKC
ncbi:hypothetical protein OQA88_1000 [Cercophora sp. LCS_1]